MWSTQGCGQHVWFCILCQLRAAYIFEEDETQNLERVADTSFLAGNAKSPRLSRGQMEAECSKDLHRL